MGILPHLSRYANEDIFVEAYLHPSHPIPQSWSCLLQEGSDMQIKIERR
jgi:hypothetical protein